MSPAGHMNERAHNGEIGLGGAHDGAHTWESWSRPERLRATNFLSASFHHYEVLHTHRRFGVFEEELWGGTEARLRDSLDSPAIRDWWAESKPFYAKSFVAYVDEIVAEWEAIEAIARMNTED